MRDLFALAAIVCLLAGARSQQLPYLTDDSRPVCATCSCKDNIVPFFVDCSKKQLAQTLVNWQIDAKWGSSIMLEVDYSDNQITQIPELPAMPVQTLSFRGNSISSIAPGAFKQLRFITYLDLSRNLLADGSLNTDTFKGEYNATEYEPLSLVELNLGYNRLTKLERSAFEHLPRLQVLILDGNPLSLADEATAAAIASLNQLQTLGLANMGIKTLSDTLIQGLAFAKLRWLNLEGNFFDSLPTGFTQLKALTKLNLNNNSFISMERSTFLGLEALTQLKAGSMANLTRIEEGAFTSVPLLDTLYLNDNAQLDFLHPDAFEEIPAEGFRLRNLHLGNNKLRYLPQQLVPDFSNWKDLSVLDLRGNPWACDCHNEWLMMAVLPNIEEKTPELLSDIKCASPAAVRGRRMVDVAAAPKDIECNPGDNFYPYSDTFGLSPSQTRRAPRRPTDRLAMGVAVMCFIAIMVSVVSLALLYVRRQRQAHYRSLHNVHFNRSEEGVSTRHPDRELQDMHPAQNRNT